MWKPLSNPTFRRFALYGLILLALTLSSAVLFVVATDEPVLSDEEAFPPPVVIDPERRPQFLFPEEIRTCDLEINRFIDRFARVCMSGKYDDFRLMISRRQPPILPPRFESNFNALKQIRITAVEKLPDMPQANAPLYVMQAECELKDFAAKKGERTKQVQVAILREDGDLRLGPLPSGAAEKLAAYRAQQAASAASQPSARAESKPQAPVQPARKVIANGAARIGP
jgi:hypothetical protein